jgi:fido (protein-threonine AMPylation protein)
LHPFREGNGRTIRELVREICFDCGYAIWYFILPSFPTHTSIM